jgi:hypothetical protein
MSSSTASKSLPVVLDVNAWTPTAFKFMPPKVNDKGGKSINVVSTQTNRSLHVSTPLLTTWGISDFVDPQTGESDGKFQISLTFPNESYATKNTEMFLDKMRQLENAIIEAAAKNSELWWGESLDIGILKHTFFPTLKYPKVKGTKKPDLTKMPNINAKVPFYEKENRWNVEIYDTTGNLMFPCENEELTPSHFVPRLSGAACVLQCGGIWIGGKGWGVTWKLVQAVVKPKEIMSVFGKCHIKLSDEELSAIEKNDDAADDEPSATATATAAISTHVEDSDSEEEDEAPAPVVVAPAPKVVESKPVAAPAPVATPKAADAPVTVVKKVVKKVTAAK